MAAAPDRWSAELRGRTGRNFVEIHWLSNREGPRPRRKEWAGATAVASDLPADLANSLFVHAPIADVSGLISEATTFFRHSLVWRITVPGSLRGSVGPAALAAGMRAAETVPRMFLYPIPPAPTGPAGLTVRRVSTARELREFCSAAGRGFGIPPWLLRLSMRQLPTAVAPGAPTIRRFVGHVDGSPVATSAQVTTEGVAGIFFVTTIPEARRHGYGAALTWAALEDARTGGAEASWLQASVMGRPVYEKMGYRQVDEDLSWVSPLSGVGQLRTLLRVLGLALLPRKRGPPRID